jgi:hypothetical protein
MTPELYFVTADGLIGNANALLIVRSDEVTWEELQEAVGRINPKSQVMRLLQRDKGIRPNAVPITKATAFTTLEGAQKFRKDLEEKGWVWLDKAVSP